MAKIFIVMRSVTQSLVRRIEVFTLVVQQRLPSLTEGIKVRWN